MESTAVFNSPLLRKWINPFYLDENNLNTLRNEFLTSLPFPHLPMRDLVVEENLELVIEELQKQEFVFKESDLFQLAQTKDFANIENELLTELRSVFSSAEFRSLLEYITNTPLSEDIDMLGNIYTDTDYLLCHDDELERRKIAYILYLTTLNPEDGGTLNLFNTREGQPVEVVKQLVPEYNCLTIFRVTPISFHEVAEILNEETFRVSISGWFNA